MISFLGESSQPTLKPRVCELWLLRENIQHQHSLFSIGSKFPQILSKNIFFGKNIFLCFNILWQVYRVNFCICSPLKISLNPGQQKRILKVVSWHWKFLSSPIVGQGMSGNVGDLLRLSYTLLFNAAGNSSIF